MWAFAHQDLRISSDEFWSLTWRELDALSTTWHKRERRLDARVALLRFTMYGCFVKDPPDFEDLLPPEEELTRADEQTEEEQQQSDELSRFKLDVTMAQFGGTLPAERTKPAEEPEPDEFTKKMWKLMGITN